MARATAQCLGTAAVQSAGGAGKLMILGPDRVLYAGLLGAPTRREFGCLTIYAALGQPLRVGRHGQDLQSAEIAVVPPYTPHRVESPERRIGVLMIEPEGVDLERLPKCLQGGSSMTLGDRALIPGFRATFDGLVRGDFGGDLTGVDLDLLFFGRVLAGRRIDPRIRGIVDRIRREPHRLLSAEESAHLCGLSFSRFLHLFRSELGATFRGFRAWKRARSFLRYANGAPSLTDVALEIGYPDSTHFSHSIRQVYGLRPKDIFAGSRDLPIVRQSASA